MSARFARIFMQAGAADLRFHDLRHEATCRLYEKTMLAGVELMHMIRKGQFVIDGAASMSFADQFDALARQVRPA